MIRIFVSAFQFPSGRASSASLNSSFLDALNEGNPGLNLGEEAVDSLEGAFRRVREVVLSASLVSSWSVAAG